MDFKVTCMCCDKCIGKGKKTYKQRLKSYNIYFSDYCKYPLKKDIKFNKDNLSDTLHFKKMEVKNIMTEVFQ